MTEPEKQVVKKAIVALQTTVNKLMANDATGLYRAIGLLEALLEQ